MGHHDLKEDGGLDPGVGVYAVATVQEEIGCAERGPPVSLSTRGPVSPSM
jgi:hypothetical protein